MAINLSEFASTQPNQPPLCPLDFYFYVQIMNLNF